MRLTDLLVLSLACLASMLSALPASAHPHEQHEKEHTEERIRQEKEPMNGLGFGYTYSFHLLKSRTGANGSEPPDNELLFGIMLAYERVLIVNWLTLVIAKPIYWGRDRFDSPIEIVLKGTYRKNSWEPFLGFGISSNLRVFKGERADVEGKNIDYTFGFGPTFGFTYFIKKHWGVAFELTYAFIPSNDTFEHEFGNSLVAGYFF
ncbi:MAG: hypothetical protein WBM75_07450 [Polyangiales bacterium]